MAHMAIHLGPPRIPLCPLGFHCAPLRFHWSPQERPELGLRIVPYYGDVKLGEDNTFFSRCGGVMGRLWW